MLNSRILRNDLGLLFFVTLDQQGPVRLEAVPLKIGRCHTGFAVGADADYVQRRFRRACAALGTVVEEQSGRSVIVWR
jgi:poly-gamma-glutamate synthesis protein (capsule biosynthesis protein)